MANSKTTRHNNLTRAPLPLSLYEDKIFTLLLACLNADMVEFPQDIRISVKEVTGTDDLTATDYELIQKACLSLLSRRISLLPPNATKYDFSWVCIVQDIQHIKGTGYIEACFANKIVPYLLQVKEWQFYFAEQKSTHAAIKCEQTPIMLALEFFLQSGRTVNETQISCFRGS